MKVAKPLDSKQMEAIEAVQKINNELHDKFGWNNPNLPVISITIAGVYTFISVNIRDQEIKLYNSSEDDRIYYEKSGKYETFYSYIKRKYRSIKEHYNNIKL